MRRQLSDRMSPFAAWYRYRVKHMMHAFNEGSLGRAFTLGEALHATKATALLSTISFVV